MNEHEARQMAERLEGEGFTVEVVNIPARGHWQVVVHDGDITWKCDPDEQKWRPVVELDPNSAEIPDHRVREQLYRAVWG